MTRTGKMKKVMGEYQRGMLKSGSGQMVTKRKQAIAIALHTSRKMGYKVPKAKNPQASRLYMAGLKNANFVVCPESGLERALIISDKTNSDFKDGLMPVQDEPVQGYARS